MEVRTERKGRYDDEAESGTRLELDLSERIKLVRDRLLVRPLSEL